MILENKLIEVRDRGTFIPALAIKLVSDSSPESYLLRRAGYGGYDFDVLLAKIDGGNVEMQYDPYEWRVSHTRTMHEAHKILIARWDAFKSGDVLDVEFELGETQEKKGSESESES